MSNRKVINEESEVARVARFVRWLNDTKGERYKIVEHPDPPDFIISNGHHRLWIELAHVFRSAEEAHERYSFVTPGEKPYSRCEHPIVEPDLRFANALVNVLSAKLAHESYRGVFRQLGPGILLLTERDWLFDESTLRTIHEIFSAASFEIDFGFFRKTYLDYHIAGKGFYREIHPKLHIADEQV